MRNTFMIACCLATLVATATPADAQWSVTPLAGVTVRSRTGYFDPDDAAKKRKIVLGAALARTWSRLGVEAEVASVPSFFSGDRDDAIITSSGVHTVMGNLIVNLPRAAGLRPYALLGAGAAHVSMRDVADIFPVSEWQLLFNVGAGFMVPASRRISVGVDARYFRSRSGEGSESSIGFGATFVDFVRISARMTVALGGS